MNTGQLIQFGLSLVAVLALAWLVKLFGLGKESRIADAEAAKRIAADSIFGFVATNVAVDRAGYAALARDAAGRHVLIRPHGVHFVARLLSPTVAARLDRNFLTLAPDEPDFPPVTLNLGDQAQYWASGLRHIPRG
jgi:hypothetical protein